jgi:hypothetical protein
VVPRPRAASAMARRIASSSDAISPPQRGTVTR